VHNAWLKTIEDGIHTYDIFAEGVSKEKVGTKEFAAAVVKRLGQTPTKLKAVQYAAKSSLDTGKTLAARKLPAKETVGVDVFLTWRDGTPAQLGEAVKKCDTPQLHLSAITNRGLTVWPKGHPETFCTDHWVCRYLPPTPGPIKHQHIVDLLSKLASNGFDFIKTENLCTFDGQVSYSLGQGS
jgi:isocitrate dehydrogenase